MKVYLVGQIGHGCEMVYKEFSDAQDYVLCHAGNWYIEVAVVDETVVTCSTRVDGKWHGRFEL